MSAPIHEPLIAARSWGLNTSSSIATLSILTDGDHYLSSIARTIGLTTAAITAIAHQLVDLGYAKRLHEDRLGQDRRSIRLVITPVGRHVIHCITNAIHAPKPALASH